MKGTILTQDKVASTISIINQYLRMALHQAQTKNPKFIYFTFKGNTVEEVVDFITIRNAKSALVIDDLGLQIINRLLQEGVTDITLCLTRFPKELMTTVKYIIQNSFPSIKINIIHYEEIPMIQNVDLIISNPAYGKIGADITYKIKDQVTYREFINLLPANDYKRNSDKNLFNFQSDMIPVPAGFEDAAVTTHLARIHKNKANDVTLDEFERSQYIDRSLDKYFEENSKRVMTTLFDTSILSAAKNYDVNTTFIIGWRDPVNKHMPYKKDVTTYLWNVEELIDFNYVIEHHLNKANNSVPFGGLIFRTTIEKKNYSNFVYSKGGFKFMAKLFTAVQSDMLKTMSTYFIKVDWTRSWTVEEILRDYGYTEEEIIEVMNDLSRFKGMDD
jgi:hypothetical protein